MSTSSLNSDALALRMEILHPNFLEKLLYNQREYVNNIENVDDTNVCVPPRPYGSMRLKSCFDELSHTNSDKTRRSNTLKVKKSSAVSKKHDDPIGQSDNKDKRTNKLRFIFEEMVHFEHRFLETLRILKSITDELDSKLPPKECMHIREIFKDIPSLYQLHQLISKSLDELKPEETGELLPSAFVNDKEIPFLNIYKSFMCRYASNYPALVNHNMKDKEFASLCRNVVQTSKYEEQRIQDVCGMYFGVHCSLTRFRLLFSKALKVLSDLLQISEGEVLRQDKISDAQVAFAKMDGCQLNFRHIPPLLREGPCKKIPRRSSHKRSLDRHLFLFSGYLVITEAANAMGRYQVKSELPLIGMSLTELSEDDEISTPHCFRIKATELCVELAFANETDKSEWWSAIQSAIGQVMERKDSIIPAVSVEKPEGTAASAAEWVKDEQSTMCAECYSQFTVLNRRHHCRACGKVFCGSCSAYRAPIAYLGGKVKRVCVIDYYLIHGDLKPPTAAIMEGILRRTQKESASIETGYMYWSVFSQGAWNGRPSIKNTKSTPQHKYLTLNVDQLSACQTPQGTFFFSTPSSSGDVEAERCGLDPSNLGDEESSGSLHPRRKSTPSSRHTMNGGSSDTLATASKVRSPVHHSPPTVCLCRIYCVLQADTLLSMYAARADTRAKDQLPLLGTRLFYLDSVSSEARTTNEVADQKRTGFWAASNTPTSSSSRHSHSSLPSSPSQTSLTSSTARRVQRGSSHCSTTSLTSSSSSASSNAPSDSSEEFHLLKPSEVRMHGNPLYRNHKPPTIPIKPKHLSDAVRAMQEISDGHVTRIAGQFETQARICQPQEPTKPQSPPPSGFSHNEMVEQLTSISPTVLGVLHNRLGFLLLPMNTDCLAHYFEAPSYEVRTRWIKSIRQACIDYLSK